VVTVHWPCLQPTGFSRLCTHTLPLKKKKKIQTILSSEAMPKQTRHFGLQGNWLITALVLIKVHVFLLSLALLPDKTPWGRDLMLS
jgi:hypothetical protein